jgi:DNA-binding transcriptional regulator YhcF (GntR family)
MKTYLETEVKTFIRKALQLGIGLEDIVKLINETYEEVKSGKQ